MSRIQRLTFAWAIPPFLCLSISLFGQSTGAIQGTVMDATSSPIPNASVTIKEEYQTRAHAHD